MRQINVVSTEAKIPPERACRSHLVNEPTPFEHDELFFSRTDTRGIIVAGNEVFRRISQYEWEELLHKPHNIIRHPDMPKAVFWLLWNTIKRGEPIGAYVKNRAKDGRYYWVFAIVTPIDGHYLSVRLKPSSPIFDVVEKEYNTLRQLEITQQLTPQESADLLLQRLGELGFPNYLAFMATALSEEVKAHDTALKRKVDLNINQFDQLQQEAQSVLALAENIFNAYTQSQYVPLNLKVQAAQLGDQGSTIGVISSNYTIIANEIKESMGHFMHAAHQVSSCVNQGLFLTCVAKVQHEILEQFSQEQSKTEHKDSETNYLQSQRKMYQDKALDGLKNIAQQTASFHQGCKDMKRLAAGLEVTRMMGKVESARLSVSAEGLNELIDDLDIFQSSVSEGLKEIETMNRAIQHNTQTLLQ